MSNQLKIEEIQIGMELTHSQLGTVSTVTNKTSNSVELFNRTDPNNRYKTGQTDADGVVQSGKRKGFSGKNWYTMQDFNKLFIV